MHCTCDNTVTQCQSSNNVVHYTVSHVINCAIPAVTLTIRMRFTTDNIMLPVQNCTITSCLTSCFDDDNNSDSYTYGSSPSSGGTPKFVAVTKELIYAQNTTASQS